MNEDFAICPKGMQEVCFGMNVNNGSSRLPMIVIQTPAEVEAGLFTYLPCNEAPGSQDYDENTPESLSERHPISNKQGHDICNFQESSERCPQSFGSSVLDPAKNITMFQFSSKPGRNVEFENEWRTRMPARKGRSNRSKAKKSTANEQKSAVEDALFAFKKMKLTSEDITDDDLMD